MSSVVRQLELPLLGSEPRSESFGRTLRERLAYLLEQDLDFHDQSSSYWSHNLHSFPAKFPPQLPHAFIAGLTAPGEVVLDPMAGSGTTIVEAILAGRHAVGFDIDPLALLLCKVKTTPLDAGRAQAAGAEVLRYARFLMFQRPSVLAQEFERRFDERTRGFVRYWFRPETQAELLALVLGVERIDDAQVQAFLKVTLSSTIITKSGGVSLARDLGHTRPHRAEDKETRLAIVEFGKRLARNLQALRDINASPGRAQVACGDAQYLPLGPSSVDLVVTSPPYASNAIDYLRAHKFSLVWLGHPVDALTQKRRGYIGGEATTAFQFEELPPVAAARVKAVGAVNPRKGHVLHRYYSEMARSLREMLRVLRPGRAAVVVIGTSVMQGVDTLTHECLASIAESLGFDVVGIATRRLDRDRRMMPARSGRPAGSQIEQRMHEEYVIGLRKPGDEAGAPVPSGGPACYGPPAARSRRNWDARCDAGASPAGPAGRGEGPGALGAPPADP